MTAHRDLKNIIRERQKKTGESYTAARAHVMRDRAALLGLEAGSPATMEPARDEAVVLKVNDQSVRVRTLDKDGQVTFRSRDVWKVVPGHLVTLLTEKLWMWQGHAYACGRIENPRVEVEKLGLIPLPIKGGELVDLRPMTEPYRNPDPYAPVWRKLTAKPRAWYEMDPIAWGAFPGRDGEENPTCDAAELAAAGDHEGARALLMEVLCTDLRCLDAHAHLGNLEFAQWPARAMIHYEIGVRIGELSVPPGFDGVLVWGRIYNRPFLRCLYGYGLCLWRLGKLAEARRVFERILCLSPHDNQGVRFCWEDVRDGRSWEEVEKMRGVADAERRGSLH